MKGRGSFIKLGVQITNENLKFEYTLSAIFLLGTQKVSAPMLTFVH